MSGLHEDEGGSGGDARRLLGALRRSAWIVAAVAVTLTLVVVVLSLLTPSRYDATATIIRQEIATALGGSDAETARRELETIERLLLTNRVLTRAAEQLGGDETQSSVRSSVKSAIDETANIIEVTGSGANAQQAARRANRVATSLIAERTRLEQTRLKSARESLEGEAGRLRAVAESDPQTREQLEAVETQLSQLTVQEASAGSDLQLAQAAEPPESRSSPKPLRNGVLALFAGLFLGVLAALAREQIVPRPRDSREVSRLVDQPVLVEVPDVGSRRRRALLFAAENEAYQALRTAVELAMPADRQRVLLVTSALHGEGKTTVTARLGTALAQAGHKTMLVSADLRRPELHARFGLTPGAGFAEVLTELQSGRTEDAEDVLRETLKQIRLPARRRMLAPLDILLSGEGSPDPSVLLSMEAMRAFVRLCRQLDHRYVLVDAPPLLGLSDTQVMAQTVEELLVVLRLDRLTVDRSVDLREALRRVENDTLGLVVIGGRTETSPYYLPDRGAPRPDLTHR